MSGARTCEGGGLYLRADDRSSSNWTALSSRHCHAYRRIWPVADGPSCIFTGVAAPVWKRACFMAEAAKRNIRRSRQTTRVREARRFAPSSGRHLSERSERVARQPEGRRVRMPRRIERRHGHLDRGGDDGAAGDRRGAVNPAVPWFDPRSVALRSVAFTYRLMKYWPGLLVKAAAGSAGRQRRKATGSARSICADRRPGSRRMWANIGGGS